ncbi:hypothetical protein [Bacillus sp. UNC41MFS5]|uniref:hypothetical protein n=1 Tax=Bacillus sp. UNC41MFS5 TaxID=1449046 RepID=UPI0012DD76C9|nr:hypothetical protein [Bacillus sp. UNC41MFS5]
MAVLVNSYSYWAKSSIISVYFVKFIYVQIIAETIFNNGDLVGVPDEFAELGSKVGAIDISEVDIC